MYSSMMDDIEKELFIFCLRKKGKWWAGTLFANQEVWDYFVLLRDKTLEEIVDFL